MAHTYDEHKADEAETLIRTEYIIILEELAGSLEDEA
jgi:hypothetical protein